MTLRLDHFMAQANAAYYAERDPYADFTTAPEISQVFGEILGLWAALVWESMGSPQKVILAEAGPGRGTLMADALRAIRATMPRFAASLRLHLIETSASLRAAQAARLDATRLDATWHDDITDLPPGPCILLANEFLDALPIRQFVRREVWKERFVADGRFVECDSEAQWPDAPDGTVIERCDAALRIAGHLGRRLASEGGAALFIDYGPAESAPGDSLQALRHGRPVDPLRDPGQADLTAHVDFAAFAAAATGCVAHGPVPQGPFLTRLGLHQRTARLAEGLPPAKAGHLLQSAARLAEPHWMGRLFKVLAICHPSLPQPPGFAA
jgi:SAM-dependent MidA family methyltransferase